VNLDKMLEILGLPDLLTLATEVGIPPDQAFALQANDLPILLVHSDASAKLSIPLKEVKWLDERMFCRHVHNALRNSRSAVVPPPQEVAADCTYLAQDNFCNINGKSRLCICAFCDPEYDWLWVAEHSQACQHQKGEYNASQKD
jgi:hypothetical protein